MFLFLVKQGVASNLRPKKRKKKGKKGKKKKAEVWQLQVGAGWARVEAALSP